MAIQIIEKGIYKYIFLKFKFFKEYNINESYEIYFLNPSNIIFLF